MSDQQSTPTPDSAASVSFLERWRPGGPWVLSAIAVDKKSMLTETFRDPAACLAWVERHNGTRNLYFHVNSCTRDVQKKAEREDVASLDWLHVDLDPRANEDVTSERERILRKLLNPPEGLPAPTCIIFSGGGYQGFWKLREPVPIGGDLEKAEDAKLWNLDLEQKFAADHCHNVDRIMRLPGTINIPDARKAAKGRVRELARLELLDDARVYDIAQFAKARPPAREAAPGEGHRVSLGEGEGQRIASVEALAQWDVPERARVIIAQGRHPDEGPKQGDNSRSAWLFDAVCSLVRCKVPDAVILGVITDPQFAISASVLEHRAKAHQYAVRQIENAKEHAIDPRLREMNEQFFVVGNMGGKCRVGEWEVIDRQAGTRRVSFQAFTDFHNRFKHREVPCGTDKKGNSVMKPLGVWWTGHGNRRQYEYVAFEPGLTESDMPDALNLWQGFTVDAREGDCSLYLNHMREVVCAGNEEHYEYLLSWMAYTVQKPWERGHIAVVLRGKQGAGKSSFVHHFGRLFGTAYFTASHSEHVTGKFNAHLWGVVLLLCDEAFFAADRRHEAPLKTLITEEKLVIELKGVDAKLEKNRLHIFLSTNSEWAVPAGTTERRFFVLDVADKHRVDHDYFGAIDQQMSCGGRAALLHLLQNRSLDGFEPRTCPKTAALNDQKRLSMSQEQKWWDEKLHSGVLLSEKPTIGWPDTITKSALQDDYLDWCKRMNVQRPRSLGEMSHLLGDWCPGLERHRRLRVDGQRLYCYSMDGWFEAARAAWSTYRGVDPATEDWAREVADPEPEPDGEPPRRPADVSPF